MINSIDLLNILHLLPAILGAVLAFLSMFLKNSKKIDIAAFSMSCISIFSGFLLHSQSHSCDHSHAIQYLIDPCLVSYFVISFYAVRFARNLIRYAFSAK